jgi:hypothetical protein
MKGWDLRHQKKQHEQRIKNAKSTISTSLLINSLENAAKTKTSTTRVKVVESPKAIHETSIYKFLKPFKLQQYAKVWLV